MNHYLLSDLPIVILIIWAWALTGATQAKQKTPEVVIPLQQTRCAVFNSKELKDVDSKESQRFIKDPVVQNFQLSRRSNPQALDELVASGDKSLVPYLEYAAQMEGGEEELVALIKLGDTEKFNQLVTQTRCIEGARYTDADYSRQKKAIDTLGLLKTTEAYQALYSLLDDTSIPAGITGYLPMTRSQLAQMALFKAVKTPPEGLIKPNGGSNSEEERVVIWKQWLKTNNLVP